MSSLLVKSVPQVLFFTEDILKHIWLLLKVPLTYKNIYPKLLPEKRLLQNLIFLNNFTVFHENYKFHEKLRSKIE